ncbi:beta family protein [Paractinoplanes hotanensis]|uniref:Beta family protein n=1 Tax=Paractinoplanes hotanensis TaxID=2906497 RepID=A0ABT0Y445_9ACTN|nr:beta family protein [Actinoplanes hotanensis]MCM4080813.1 beta family protein [Actinoplanes hotanensis]
MAVFATTGSEQDGVYRPILRPRRGELAALTHLTAGEAARVRPILEVDPGTEILSLIRELPPRTATLAVDFSEIVESPDPLVAPSLDLAEQLGDLGITMLPVLRATESRRRLAAHGLAARMHGRHAVLRFQPHADAANPAQADVLVERMLRGAGLAADEADLLIDLAETACGAHAARFEGQLHRILRWAGGRPWRSISVASGAMPANLDELPTDRPVTIDRHDARVWSGIGRPGIGYADYGVTSPVRRRGVQRHRQLPTLRYTAEHNWWIYRWSRRGGRGDDRCHDLCRTLVASPHWPAAGARFSWGDAEIARRARMAPGAGSPAGWMSWSTSHHIAHVLRALRPDDPGID